MKSAKRSHIIILTLLISILTIAIYFKYIRVIQIKKYNLLKKNIADIERKIDTNISTFYSKIANIDKIISIKKNLINIKESLAQIKTHISNKSIVSSLIKKVILDSGVKINEFAFSGYEVSKEKYQTYYTISVEGRIFNILRLLENIEYEIDWLILNDYNLLFKDNGFVEMTFSLTAYGRVK
ncbi:hypothetical protein FHQ18_09910 [Deferribacter autotrophicus]|uniref:PilN domain-containing protein n=1 Tax=Deferribacter autotrophicus TaxID=500465 RepID=A0A5A8F1T2_9BACT|nr:hypothetical protein [Deferribacter autotrophicus]KAA0257352.1 hypothetical protein FHQ18_09910 [Deferribacter autotrophicus]